MRCLEQSLGGRLSVDGVDHHLTGTDLLHCFQPGSHVYLACVIDALAVAFTTHEHSLDDEVAVERLHVADDGCDVVGAVGMIHLINI